MPIGNTENLIVKLIGKDQFSRVFNKADKQMGSFRKKLNQVAKVGMVAGGAFAVGIGVKATQAAASFEEGMTNVATLVDTSTESMEAMGDQVKEISKKVPVQIEDLTSALYDVRSAGISASDAMDVLETSGKLATAGLSTTQEATNLLTSAINVYGDESHDANKIANILFKTVKAGKTTVAELSQGFGKVAAIAKETGISIEDLSAATAVLTTGGIKAAEAQTALKAMIANVLKPTKDATNAAEELGIKFDLGALQAKGLAGMMKEISEKAGDDKQALADLFGSVEAANAVFALASEEGGAAFDKILKDMKGDTDALTEGFNKQNESAAKQYQLLKNNLNVAMVDLGNKILPTLVDALKLLPYWLETISDWWNAWTDGLASVFVWIDKVGRGLGNIIGKAKSAGSKIGGIFSGGWRGSSNIPYLPFFQEGGVVPGSPNQAVPAILHGGETVIPADKKAGNTFNFNFSGAFIGDPESFKKSVIDLINKDSELRAMGGT